MLASGEPAAYVPRFHIPGRLAFARSWSAWGRPSLLVIPFVIAEERLGALVLASGSHDLSEPAWMGFARALAVQFGQTIALGRSLSRGAASETRYRV